MKKLLSFAIFASMLVACGSDTPKADDTPDIVVKKCLKLMIEGDKQAVKCFNFKSEDEKNSFLEKMSDEAKYIKEEGGIKSIETILGPELGGSAEVRYKVTFNSGQSFSKMAELTKINNTWYMYKF